ncbi:protein ssh4 [Phtheirospermum japonicum]|uniref:Protein ssh4 n=1 Tax=Phtheirospermum japonicum TaxID=374723 RepID=A0A830BHY0_9LAMI|nr:protein ssh4 [Phtheirospermum japonicum]
MINWLHITLVIAFASILILLFLIILQKCFHPKTRANIARGFSKEPQLFFSWADHPNLIAEAVENGWSRFAFRTSMSSPSVKSARVCEGSGDYLMQKIRFNPGLGKMISAVDSPTGAVSVIKTGLPLPGPRFGNSYFPQEAYFEITILPEDGKTEIIWMSVGLTGGGGPPLKIPGSFPGSVGFNSNGSVYLNGNKLVFESSNDEWPRKTEKVIGCGYNPGEKTIFLTVDSQLAHEIHCKTEEFGHPLYPMLAANTDVIVLFNLGQRPFKFAHANLQRTPNPCLIGPAGQPNSPALGYINEDSKELFSMERINSQWLQRNVTRNYNTVNSVKSLEFDQESESDLFEIVLDSMGRSPYSTTY